MEYKKGDKVRIVRNSYPGIHPEYTEYVGCEGVAMADGSNVHVEFSSGDRRYFLESELELITSPKEIPMLPVYILKKEAITVKKGAIFEVVGCYVNGYYGYRLKEGGEKFSITDPTLPKEIVESQPDWFEKVELVPVPADKIAQVKKILKIK